MSAEVQTQAQTSLISAPSADLLPHASNGNLSRELAKNRRGLTGWRGAVAKGIAIAAGGTGIGGGIAVLAQGEPGENIDPNCASPSPSASLPLESGMPSESFFSPNPDGSFDVFVSPSPLASEAPASSFVPGASASTGPDGSPLPTDPETAAIDPCAPEASPSASAPASPEPTLNLDDYSIKSFLKIKDTPLWEVVNGKKDMDEFNKIIDENAQALAEEAGSRGYSDDPKLQAEGLKKMLKDALEDSSVEVGGHTLASEIIGFVRQAERAAKLNKKGWADALFNVGEAFLRAGKSFLHFKNSPKELDALIIQFSKHE